MTTLEKLREQNPNLKIKSVTDEVFAEFGQLIALPYKAQLAEQLSLTTIPARNNQYVRDDPGMLSGEQKSKIARIFYGEQSIEIGYCNGNSSQINALEFHNCSEINFAGTDLVLFLAHRKQLIDNQIETSQTQAFFVPQGTAIEVYPTTMHFAPCRVWQSGFKCLVILLDKTNTPLAEPRQNNDLLFQRNKWLLTHQENERMMQQNAYPGLLGDNLAITPLNLITERV